MRPIDADEYERELLYDMVLHGEQLSGDAAYNRALVILTQMLTLTPQNEPERTGLYGKYTVRKNSDGSLVTDCFVLRPGKDPAAVAALRAYAAATDNAELAVDIINWVGADPNEPLPLDELLKMDGEPVYVVFRPAISGEKPQFWALVSADKQHGEVYLLDSMGGAGSHDEIWADLEGIYRRPPERQEDT